jgi:hypothetical protein
LFTSDWLQTNTAAYKINTKDMNPLTICADGECQILLGAGVRNICEILGRNQNQPHSVAFRNIFYQQATERALGGADAFDTEVSRYLSSIRHGICANGLVREASAFLQLPKTRLTERNTNRQCRDKVARILLALMVAPQAQLPGTCWAIMALGNQQADALNQGIPYNNLTPIELQKAGIIRSIVKLADDSIGLESNIFPNTYYKVTGSSPNFHIQQMVLGPEGIRRITPLGSVLLRSNKRRIGQIIQ